MEWVLAIVAGAICGVPAGRSQALAGRGSITALVMTVFAVCLTALITAHPLWATVVFIITNFFVAAMTASWFWWRAYLNPRISYWGWVGLEFIHPRYARTLWNDAGGEM